MEPSDPGYRAGPGLATRPVPEGIPRHAKALENIVPAQCSQCDGPVVEEPARPAHLSAWCFGCWRAIKARHGDEGYHNRPGELLVHDRADGAIQVGAMCPEYGPGFAVVACPTCEATWVDIPGAACPWCADRLAALVAGQREILLAAPDIDSEDATYAATMNRWADRLESGIGAELISNSEADAAWSRALAGAA